MGGFSLVVVWLSMFGAGLSTIVGTRMAIKYTTWAGSPFMRLALVISSTLSGVYAIGYWWLLNHQESVEEWSDALRPIGMLSWFIGPWIAFPLAFEHQLKSRVRQMKGKQVEILKEVESHDACAPPDPDVASGS